MDYFNYKNGELYAEGLKVDELAVKYGSPLYIYSKATLERHMRVFEESLSSCRHLVCYAVKANSSLAILNLMANLGAGFDVVSEGELRRVIAAGGDPKKAVFSGVGKTEDEIAFALEQGINCLNLESEEELEKVIDIATSLKLIAPVAVRVNPNVDAKTLPAISTGLKSNKFGISQNEALRVYKRMTKYPCLKISGIDCHIGSQMTSGMPILEATDKLLSLYRELQDAGIGIDHIDFGGGLGVTYDNETPPSPNDYCGAILQRLHGLDLSVYIEPGRAMVANAGILVTKVLYQKLNGDKRFCIVDGAMNDLIRPALYGSWMNIVNTKKRDGGEVRIVDVVGPVCESDDFLGKERKLNVKNGDFLAVRGAGAYGSSMSSNYNSRRLCAEVMVDGDKDFVIRKRQNFSDLWRDEIIPEYK